MFSVAEILMVGHGIAVPELHALPENEILKLSEIMQPLQSSNTQSAADKKDSKDNVNQQPKGEGKKAGRKEKPDDEKSEKTIQNKESMSQGGII